MWDISLITIVRNGMPYLQEPDESILKLKDPNLPPFFKTAFRLKEGQVSDPHDSPFGYLGFKRAPLEFITARHILIQFQGASRASKKRSRDEARGIAEELAFRAKSGEDFAELAKAYSEGPSAPKGGMLGRFPRGQMVPAFEASAFALQLGEVSGVVETPFGFHIIRRE